jgi:tetratricopeptide (TPR) repeat protein
VATVLPIAGIVPIGAINHADRYSYIPSFFILLSIGLFSFSSRLSNTDTSHWDDGSEAMGLTRSCAEIIRKSHRWVQSHRLMIVWICLLYALFSIVVTRYYLPAWKNLHSLMTWAYENNQRNPVVIGTLADLELQNGNLEECLRLSAELELQRDRSMNIYHLTANKLKADYLRAVCYYQMNQPAKALVYFEKIAPHLHGNTIGNLFIVPTIQAMMADSYRLTGVYHRALSLYDMLEKNRHINFELYLNRGVTHFQLGNYPDAERDFSQAMHINPHDLTIGHNLNQTRRRMKESSSGE